MRCWHRQVRHPASIRRLSAATLALRTTTSDLPAAHAAADGAGDKHRPFFERDDQNLSWNTDLTIGAVPPSTGSPLQVTRHHGAIQTLVQQSPFFPHPVGSSAATDMRHGFTVTSGWILSVGLLLTMPAGRTIGNYLRHFTVHVQRLRPCRPASRPSVSPSASPCRRASGGIQRGPCRRNAGWHPAGCSRCRGSR